MWNDLILFGVFFVGLFMIAFPLSWYLMLVMENQSEKRWRFFRTIENWVCRLIGIDPSEEMDWRGYCKAVLGFNAVGLACVFSILLLQDRLPFNPDKLPPVPWDQALNTAVSFMTNTNWQSYGGESTMSHFSQMAALTVQNFVSAATGLAVAVALMRGLTRRSGGMIGNFWLDMIRSTLFVLLPISFFYALFLVQQGTIQNFSATIMIDTLEGAKQSIAMGPVASQEAIKMLGTNGGGFFNANSAHPFENPTPLTNFVQMISILVIPTALVLMFGRMTGNRRQGYAILATMTGLFVVLLGVFYTFEHAGNPIVEAIGIAVPTAMEGKEVRFGIGPSVLFASVTTAASCGAVNAMHDSLTPVGGLVPLLQIMLGEVVFGGVGAGFYGIMIFVILTVFMVGLMVGRTPEYLGKKIGSQETKLATIAIILPSAAILAGSGIAAVTEMGLSSIANPGPHGLSELLYAFASAAGNNGSAFAGLNANTLFYNLSLAAAMLMGRFGVIIPVLAIAGSMSEKKIAPIGLGTFPTTGAMFILLLSAVIIIVGALTFLPALALGPIIEHMTMLQGITW